MVKKFMVMVQFYIHEYSRYKTGIIHEYSILVFMFIKAGLFFLKLFSEGYMKEYDRQIERDLHNFRKRYIPETRTCNEPLLLTWELSLGSSVICPVD